MIKYLLAANLLAFALCGWDKLCALRRRRRVPEHVLITLAFLGGCGGALLAMLLFRHKIRNRGFCFFVPLACLLWASVLIWL